MSSKSPVRTCDDLDETALSFAEIKALCAGNPLIKEKMDLDMDVAKLKVLKASHRSSQYRLEDNLLRYFPETIHKWEYALEGYQLDIKTVENHPHPQAGISPMTIYNRTYTDKADAGAALLEACQKARSGDPTYVGNYRGFVLYLTYNRWDKVHTATLKGGENHIVTLGNDPRGNLLRLDNGLDAIPEKIARATMELESLHNQQQAAKEELGKPFPQEEELQAKTLRLAELDVALNMSEHQPEQESEQEQERPSVLAQLKQIKEQQNAPPEVPEWEER